MMDKQVLHTFTCKWMISERSGDRYPVLTSNEYPYMNCQVLPIPDGQWDNAMIQLKNRGGWIATVDGRRDFVVIHAGGGTPVTITPNNKDQVMEDMKNCLFDAARWWAIHNL